MQGDKPTVPPQPALAPSPQDAKDSCKRPTIGGASSHTVGLGTFNRYSLAESHPDVVLEAWKFVFGIIWHLYDPLS